MPEPLLGKRWRQSWPVNSLGREIAILGTIVTALLPIVVTLGLGYFAGREANFDQGQANVLTRMVMLFALPLMLFAGILQTPLSQIAANLEVVLWLAIGMVGGFVLVFAISRYLVRAPASLSALRAIAIAGPAVPFVGTPVLGVLFPGYADIAIAAGSLIINLVLLPMALMFLVSDAAAAEGTAPKNAIAVIALSVMQAIRQPVVWAPVLAILLLLAGFDLPDMLAGSFMLLGHTTGGVALFAVGAVLYAQKISISLPVIINVAAKNIILPMAILGALVWLNVPQEERALVVVTLAMPTGSIAVIFAVQYKVGQQEIASTLGWSTILSVATLAVFIWLTG